ncbi:DUF1835 domain-containing protein [Pontibacter sp. MBLB2868]|uniref:DUF1835 domain-containing protein n=1 Tax=Pontibacter sp. MBLB2868 TaxID=3451555 RepID=UPI003F755AF4
MKQLPSLHILNGDATIPAFEAASFPGQTIIWREILSEGPVLASLPEAEFWRKRQEFISSSFKETPERYSEKVLQEVSKLKEPSSFFEIILWFDADLMCQLNLLYLLQYLLEKNHQLVSVCTPPPNHSIGLMKPGELQSIFEKRTQLSELQLKQASELWQLYGSHDPVNLQLYLEQRELLLPNIGNALKLHFTRFPDCHTGLSQPETIILNLIAGGIDTVEALMQQFWHEHPAYGFGDAQIEQILHRLQPDLVQGKKTLRLSFFGERVLQGLASSMPKPHWLGGAKIDSSNHFCFNKSTNMLKTSTPHK